jgi:hypothetical protein
MRYAVSMGEDEEPDEVVYEDGDTRTVERNPVGSSDYPQWVKRLGHWFHLLRREVVSRSGERTHNRVTYRSEGDAGERTPPD